jgi:hypothetical protein
MEFSDIEQSTAIQLRTLNQWFQGELMKRFSLLCFMFFLTLQPNRVAAAVSGSAELTERQTASLAETFSPALVFHPDEQFFPSSPLFSLKGNLSDTDPERIVEILGTPDERRKEYLSLTLPEKTRLATVYYRVRKLPRRSGEAIVIEYWLYYVWNSYSSRPGLFPFWFDGSHPNDMEQINVVLERDPEGGGNWTEVQGTHVRLETIYISAHEGGAPANRYDFAGGENYNRKTHVLVELGSHAAATDIDRDGLFTPGDDGESGYKILWGVRDKGYTWARYNPDYMEERNDENRMLFCHPGGGIEGDGGSERCPPDSYQYRLVHVDELHRQFDQLGLSRKERKQVFETDVALLKRLFGKSNGESERLVLPPSSTATRKTVAVEGFSATETGIQIGLTTLIWDPGLFFGGRYSFLHGSKIIPDVMLNAEAVLTSRGSTYLSTSILASYPIDAITKVFGGVGLVTDSITFENRQMDWIGGLEFRIGGVRISLAGRTMGPITESAIDLRLYYFF